MLVQIHSHQFGSKFLISWNRTREPTSHWSGMRSSEWERNKGDPSPGGGAVISSHTGAPIGEIAQLNR